MRTLARCPSLPTETYSHSTRLPFVLQSCSTQAASRESWACRIRAVRHASFQGATAELTHSRCVSGAPPTPRSGEIPIAVRISRRGRCDYHETLAAAVDSDDRVRACL